MFLGAEYLKGDKKPSFTKMEPKSEKVSLIKKEEY